MKYMIFSLKYLLFALVLTFNMVTVAKAASSVAVIELKKIFEEAKPAIKATRKLEKEFQPRQDVLKGKQAELELLVRNFDKNQFTWSKSRVKKEQQKIIQSRRKLQQYGDKLQRDFNQERTKAMSEVEKVIEDAIATISKRKRIDLVIYQGVGYHNPSINITDKVIDQLNKK